jgi:hypothetical protein
MPGGHETSVTDAGLEHLSGLTNLKRLDPSTGVSRQGIEKLRKALPNL